MPRVLFVFGRRVSSAGKSFLWDFFVFSRPEGHTDVATQRVSPSGEHCCRPEGLDLKEVLRQFLRCPRWPAVLDVNETALSEIDVAGAFVMMTHGQRNTGRIYWLEF